jgi:hypothetical protein
VGPGKQLEHRDLGEGLLMQQRGKRTRLMVKNFVPKAPYLQAKTALRTTDDDYDKDYAGNR